MMMKPGPDYMKLLNHFTILIYPFLHEVKLGQRQQRLESLASCWKPWWSRLSNDTAYARVLDDTYFFLPYIREIIFPETTELKNIRPGKDYANHVAELKGWLTNDLAVFYQDFSSDAVLRITYCKDALDSIADFNCSTMRI